MIKNCEDRKLARERENIYFKSRQYTYVQS